MYKRMIFLAVLALPGSFFVLAACSLYPRGRALLVHAVGFATPRRALSRQEPGSRRQ